MQDDQVQAKRSGQVERSWSGERGASLVEYALLLALIAVVCIGALSYFGSATGSGLNRSASCIKAAQDGQPLPADC
ncbi:MAG: Flp family type IVb pilin [Aquihabitans sp.]